MKLTMRHVGITALLLVLAILFGFAFDGIATAVERHNHPRPDEFAEQIAENAETFGIPEAVLWATVKVRSDFASNARDADGGIGLMLLTPARFDRIRTEILKEEPLDAGMLYDPTTNLTCGAAYLSHLYQLYGAWETVFAALVTDEATVNAWLADARYADELGMLKSIPDKNAAAVVKDMAHALSTYQKLYY